MSILDVNLSYEEILARHDRLDRAYSFEKYGGHILSATYIPPSVSVESLNTMVRAAVDAAGEKD